jgi:hypothetical protein
VLAVQIQLEADQGRWVKGTIYATENVLLMAVPFRGGNAAVRDLTLCN